MKFKIGDVVQLKDRPDLDHKFYLPLQESLIGILGLITELPSDNSPFYRVMPVVEYSDYKIGFVQALEDEMELIN